ncbi:hypothetical protein, partial [Streptomyces sp. WAC05292]|uniref:hypothetical protein n=1 Tax=Streptomyces sp. WAC05292 TaxID=2487418 RepID=UPI001C8EB210
MDGAGGGGGGRVRAGREGEGGAEPVHDGARQVDPYRLEFVPVGVHADRDELQAVRVDLAG